MKKKEPLKRIRSFVKYRIVETYSCPYCNKKFKEVNDSTTEEGKQIDFLELIEDMKNYTEYCEKCGNEFQVWASQHEGW